MKNENAVHDATFAADSAVTAAQAAFLLLGNGAEATRAYAEAARQLCLAAARACEATADQLDPDDLVEGYPLHRLVAGRAAEAQRYADRLADRLAEEA